LVATGYTHKDERRNPDEQTRIQASGRDSEATDRSEPDPATARETFERAASRTDGEATAEFARAGSGQPVKFLHRSHNPKIKFTDTRLGGDSGSATAFVKAKSAEDVANGYDEDEAPDYANAATNLAKAQGVKPAVVNAAIKRAEKKHENQVSAGRARRGGPVQAGQGGQTESQSLTRGERSAFLKRNILVKDRISRRANAKARCYTTACRRTLAPVSGLIHKPYGDYAVDFTLAEVTPDTLVEIKSTLFTATGNITFPIFAVS
jgi:hypothetical protein